MNRFNKMNDDELNSFVKQHQPKAPEAEAFELNLLKRKLNLQDKVTESNSVWLWLATGLAASFFMFHFITTNPAATPEASILAANVAPEITASTALIEDDDDYAESSVPTLDIGEDYLTLAGF